MNTTVAKLIQNCIKLKALYMWNGNYGAVQVTCSHALRWVPMWRKLEINMSENSVLVGIALQYSCDGNDSNCAKRLEIAIDQIILKNWQIAIVIRDGGCPCTKYLTSAVVM
eukprot:1306523-Amphidinium_carterae.1